MGGSVLLLHFKGATPHQQRNQHQLGAAQKKIDHQALDNPGI
jgi:hypothetical protein